MNKQSWTALAAVFVGAAVAVALSLAAGIWDPIGVAAASADVDAAVFYVAPGGNCGGASPCYGTVQGALDAAYGGDTIKVAQGVYTSSGAEVARVEKAVTLAGGYSITNWSTAYPDTQPSVLDAEDADRRGVYVDGTGLGPITLSGLTVQGGAPQAVGEDPPFGGGIYVQGGDVTIRHSLVMSNTAFSENGGGGGGLNIEGGTVSLEYNTYQDNDAIGGGGVHVQHGTVTSVGDRFLGNGAFWSGGLEVWDADVVVNDAIFQDNFAGNTGGAVAVIGPSKVVVEDSIIQDNQSANDFEGGAGIFVNDPNADVTLARNLIVGNVASYNGGSGGGLRVQSGTVVAYQNTFTGNSGAGGGAVEGGGGSLTLRHNRFVSNSAFFGGTIELRGASATMNGNVILGSGGGSAQGTAISVGGGTVDARNDVIADIANPDGEAVYVDGGTLTARHWTLANNGSYGVLLTGGTATLTNLIVSGHTTAGLSGPGITANTTLFYDNGANCADGAICNSSLSGDPAFVDPAGGDYHITIGSEAMDAGVDAGVHDDLDGHYRPYNWGPDIGADELVAAAVDPGSSTTLIYTDTLGSPTTIYVPAGAVADPITLLYTPAPTATAPAGQGFAGHAFDLDGYSGETLLPGLVLDASAAVTIAYTQTEVSGLDESTLVLYYWDGASEAWQDAACGPYVRNADENWVSVPICHLSRFALFADELHAIYLPLVLRNQ
jgi:hypothetical protein